ncbi:helix-turn-helix domain-containing protein, partial [Leptolyngbya sp. DQ-M1]|uniref:helix-turn-helix domain-containing protein n=1 Tax=Leptolyngbya sp. DQ-M1 TaxID=2933920 RepID=UPI003297784F
QKQQRNDQKRSCFSFESSICPRCSRFHISFQTKPATSCVFDLATYPPQYLPELPNLLPLAEIPDDPEQAAEFWLNDAMRSEGDRLTDLVKRPYGGFEQLLTARVLVQPPEVISRKFEELKDTNSPLAPPFALTPASTPSKPRKSERKLLSKASKTLSDTSNSAAKIESGEQLKSLRLTRGMTQSVLATKLGKSTSWVKLVETGRRNITPDDQQRLQEILQSAI